MSDDTVPFCSQLRKALFSGYRPSIFSTFLIGSFVCTAFGNAFNPVSILAWAQPSLLLIAIISNQVHRKSAKSATYLETTPPSPCVTWFIYMLVILVQASGFTIAFAGFFSRPDTSLLGLSIIFAFGLILWSLLIALCFRPHIQFCQRFPHSSMGLLVFPALWSAAWKLLSLTPIGIAFNPSTSLVEGASLTQSVSLFGVFLVVFLQGWIASVVSLSVHSYFFALRTRSLMRHVQALAVVFTLLLVYGGFRAMWVDFYQRDFSETLQKAKHMSCITGPAEFEALSQPETRTWLQERTQERIAAGDDLIVWSEASLMVDGVTNEDALKQAVQSALHQTGSKALVALSYIRTENNRTINKNNMVLISSEGVVSQYDKSCLVPLVETMAASPRQSKLPISISNVMGKIGGAICMDMQMPSYLHQAGLQKVDLLIETSWTWGPTGFWAFKAERLRAVENGFGWIRCSSGGVSAIVSPYGRTHFFRRTGHNDVFTVEFPLFAHVPTVYTYIGFLFPWICVFAAAVVVVALILPDAAIARLNGKRVGSFLVGEPSMVDPVAVLSEDGNLDML